VKGSPEVVMQACQTYIDSNGNKHKLSDYVKAKFETKMKAMGTKGYRTIMVAYVKILDRKDQQHFDERQRTIGPKTPKIQKNAM